MKQYKTFQEIIFLYFLLTAIVMVDVPVLYALIPIGINENSFGV